jgi:hypothetical protein
MILMIFVQIYIAVWVYKDAKKRNMDNLLWLIIVVIFGLLGLILYLLIRKPIPTERSALPKPIPIPDVPSEPEIPPEKPLKLCTSCGSNIPMEAEFCPYCGIKS